ncbi:DHA3 family macrolide efflux protein-like MFS transporter [Salana multivorans]|uniref:DHA3 family macrolide efflux protein-like MFS transporter n=2 Tax=Salana multivorans TaxID=120377 RepID=A0A3N2D9B4_9MICO|nr:DHA3 family macrolide efflux protein-like MFS transporter [Salana multivorans]
MDPMLEPDIPATEAADAAEVDAAPVPENWVRNVVLFLGGQTVSLFGSMLVQYAVMWYLTLTTKEGTVLALATIFGFVPQAVISIFGGVWADRHNRKYLVMGADAAIAVATLALAVLMLRGSGDLWLIYAVMAVRSAGAGIQTPAVGALVPQIVPASQLLRINGLNQSIQAGMMLLAPAIAAILYANLEIGSILFIDVATAVIGIGFLALVPVPTLRRTAGQERPAYFADLVGGVRYISGHRLVRWLLGLFFVVMLLGGAPSFLTPLMVARTFGEEMWKLTALELAFSIGMMIAGATIGWWGARTGRIQLILIGSVAFAVCTLGLGLSPVLWVFLVFMFLFGLAVPAFSTPSTTIIQEVVPMERQGRVFGFLGIVGAVSMPLGVGVFGPLADVWSVQVVLVIAGGLTFVALALALLTPTGRWALAQSRVRDSALAYGASPEPAPGR